MKEEKYVYLKNNRLFINTSLGCRGKCLYCYLPKIGLNNECEENNIVTAKQIIELIKKQNIEVKKDTLITIGCYSECLDKNNKKEAIELIKYFLKKGNQIQLSTKEKIYKEDFLDIINLIQYKGQLIIFVSAPTISKQKEIEINTLSIEERLSNFELLNEINIPSVLYIKPVLKNITIKDINIYINIIKKYDIQQVVVGSIFSEIKSGEPTPFFSNNKLFYMKNSEEDIIIKQLSKYSNVSTRSTEVVKKYSRGEI